MRKGRGATQKPQRDSVLLGGAAVAIAVDVGGTEWVRMENMRWRKCYNRHKISFLKYVREGRDER